MDEMQYCPIDGHKLAYRRMGSGEPMIMLHGITTYSFIWRKIAPLLAAKFDVITTDLLGCGDSDMPTGVSYALKDHAERVLKLAEALGLKRFHLVGHDLGGGITQIVCVRRPEKVISATLINSVAYDFWPVQPIIAMRTPIIRQLAMAALDFGAFKALVKRGTYHKELVTPELMEHYFKPMRTTAGRKAFLNFAKCLDNRDLVSITDKLHELDIPFLIIRGDGDLYLAEDISLRLDENLKKSKLARIDEAGHFIHEDQPNWLVDRIIGFIEGLEGSNA